MAYDHNHLTRAIRPRGECPGCDKYHAKQALAPTPPVVDPNLTVAYDTAYYAQLQAQPSRTSVCKVVHEAAHLAGLNAVAQAVREQQAADHSDAPE